MKETFNHMQKFKTREIVVYQPDEITKLEVRVEGETVWLNRHQLADLFGRDIKTIGKHINNAGPTEAQQPIRADNIGPGSLHPRPFPDH